MTESSSEAVFEGYYQTLLRMYPEKCTGRGRDDGVGPCDSVAAAAVWRALKVTQDQMTIEAALQVTRDDVDVIASECIGLQLKPDGGGCFGSPYSCGRQTSTEVIN